MLGDKYTIDFHYSVNSCQSVAIIVKSQSVRRTNSKQKDCLVTSVLDNAPPVATLSSRRTLAEIRFLFLNFERGKIQNVHSSEFLIKKL